MRNRIRILAVGLSAELYLAAMALSDQAKGGEELGDSAMHQLIIAAALLHGQIEPPAPPKAPSGGWYLRPANVPDNAVPIIGIDGFTGGHVIGWFVPPQPPLLFAQPKTFFYPQTQATVGLVPKPPDAALIPWIPPGTMKPLPQLGTSTRGHWSPKPLPAKP